MKAAVERTKNLVLLGEHPLCRATEHQIQRNYVIAIGYSNY